MHPQRGDDGSLNFVLPMGDAPLPGIAVADIGACAAAIFRRGEATIGQAIGIAGEHLNGAQMAAALSRALGEPVRHVAMDPADYAALGFPGAADLANMFRFKRDFNAEFCARARRRGDARPAPGADALRGLPRASRRAVADRAARPCLIRATGSVTSAAAAAVQSPALDLVIDTKDRARAPVTLTRSSMAVRSQPRG